MEIPTEILPDSGIYLGLISGALPHRSSESPLSVIITLSKIAPLDKLSPKETYFHIPEGRKGLQSFMTKILPESMEIISSAINERREVVVRDEDGKDLAVCLVMACLWKLFDDVGNRRAADEVEPKGNV